MADEHRDKQIAARQNTSRLGPMSEAGVGFDCRECEFQTEDEDKGLAHFARTGHSIAIDYIDHESPEEGS